MTKTEPTVTILAIDDDRQSLNLVSAALEQEGVQILTADDPERGLEIVRQEHPQIVLLDLTNPEMLHCSIIPEGAVPALLTICGRPGVAPNRRAGPGGRASPKSFFADLRDRSPCWGIGQGASPRSGAANGLLRGPGAAARASGVRSRAAPPVTQAAAQSRSPRLPRCPDAVVLNRRIQNALPRREVTRVQRSATMRRAGAAHHRTWRFGTGVSSGVGHCADGACSAVVVSGWRGNDPAHLTNERPRRARCEQREHHPLDDTVCAAEAGGAVAHPARKSG